MEIRMKKKFIICGLLVAGILTIVISMYQKDKTSEAEHEEWIKIQYSNQNGAFFNRSAWIDYHNAELLNETMDTYRDSEPGIGKIWASDYAAGIYKIASGKDVPNPDGTYTITGTLDERHKDTNISGYLSYSTDGKLMYTPLTYSGDKAYIESVDGFMEFGRTQILDFSDKLSTPSFADEDSQKLLEELLKGENE